MPFCFAYAQNNDSTRNTSSKKNKSFLKFFVNALTRSGVDSSMQPSVLISKNELPYVPYEGKVIRRILVREFGFDKTIIDTTKEIDYFGKNFVNHLHRNTREGVIRNNLFIKERSILNANLVADNERYLRSLAYMHDARILVATIADESDSVDLLVITKDVLSITLELNAVEPDRFKAKIGDANLMGTGQKIRFTTLVEQKRDPNFGYEILYEKSSIANTFVNATISYSNIGSDLYNGTPDEHTWRVQIERPLVSQYLHMAGAITLSHSETSNHYTRPDSLFYNYRYKIVDALIGYNLGIRKFLFRKSNLNRHFISLRYFQNNFTEAPYQVKDRFNFRFNDRQAVLAQITFFRQNFYKTNYVFGFGITEDVPYGYNIALTGGWYKQMDLKRPYAGVDANLYSVSDQGNIMQYFLRTGSFFNKGKVQDAAILIGATAFSRVFIYKNFKMRQYLQASYTKQLNRIGLDPLGINNAFGLRYIPSDSASGHQRASLHTETFVFLRSKVLGFRFAPFTSADVALFTPEHGNFLNSGLYFGFGGGVRTRNETILFGTIELRLIYFPRKSEQYNAFKIMIRTNLRFKYNSNYVKAPDIIQVNNDFDNNIY